MPRKLNDWIESYMEYTDRTEPPALFRKWTGVAALAAAIERKAWLTLGNIVLFPNFYIVLVSPPGKARKGTALAPARTFMEKLDINLAPNRVTRSSLTQELVDSQDTFQIGKDIVRHASLTVYSSELTVFTGYRDKELMGDLMDLFDCPNEWEYRTIARGKETLDNVWFNLIGATTPESVRAALPEDAEGAGLSSRIIFVYEETIDIPIAWPEYKDNLFKPLRQDLEHINENLIGPFAVSQSFKDEYEKWYVTQYHNPPFDEGTMSGYLSRRQVHLTKLALVMSASESDDKIITAKHFNRARRLLEETELRMPRTFATIGSSDNVEVVSKLMRSLAQGEKLTLTQLYNRHWRDLNSFRHLQELVESIEKSGFVNMVRAGGATTLTVNKSHQHYERFK